MGEMKRITIEVAEPAAETFERLARDTEDGDRGQLFLKMLILYEMGREFSDSDWESVQRYGDEQARTHGIQDEGDVQRLIEEYRREHRPA